MLVFHINDNLYFTEYIRVFYFILYISENADKYGSQSTGPGKDYKGSLKKKKKKWMDLVQLT